MNAEQMWAAYAARSGLADAPYEAWAFGGEPDKLARLTLEGIKTATSSAYPLYTLEGEPLPEAGEHSVILDSREEAVCVIRTERVAIVPFREISPEHARREGEGDRSLPCWRQVHEAFFTRELTRAGLSFYPDMPVVCEYFRRVWPEGPAREEAPPAAPGLADPWLTPPESSLRGAFLREMREKYEAAPDEAAREKVSLAIRLGLAALEGQPLE